MSSPIVPTRLRRRDLLAGLALLGGAGLLAACGAPAAAPTATPAASKPAEPAKPAATTQPAAQPAAAGTGPKILLRLNGIDPPGQEFANKFVADYNAQNKVAIEIDYTDWASSFQKITTGLAGGTAPDIFMGGGLWTPVIASKGGTLELDNYIKDMGEWSDWYEVARQDVTYSGKVHAIPYRMNARGNIIYRKSLFEKAGLDPTKPPTNWEEALNMALKLTQKDGSGKVTVAGWHIVQPPIDLSQQYEDALFQMDGNYFNADRTKPLNNTPEGEAALQFWVNFVEKGVVPKEGMDSGVPNLNAYTAGKIALFPGWPQDMLNTKLNAPQIWEDTLTAPPLKQKVQKYQIYVDKYMIYKRTKAPDESFKLVRALVTGEAGIKLGIEGTWGLPARKDHEKAPSYNDPRMKVFLANIQYGKPRQIVPQHFDVQPTMGRHVEMAVKGVKPVKETLKEMDDAVLKIIQG
jgi:ABC-type glycerol-3-phosphate transport system substrate-binding protein